MEAIEKQKEMDNPWLTIWIRPRGTIRQIVDSDPERHVILLAILSGIFRFLDNASERGMGDNSSLFIIIFLALTIGSVGGLTSLYIGGALFSWSGRLLGGEAPSDYVRAAIAWSSVPDVVLLVIFIPIIAVFGVDWFASSPTWIAENEPWSFFLIGGISFVGIALILWRAFLFVKCLAEVHRISAWKGLAAAIVGFLAIAVPVFILVFACGALT